MRRLVAVSAALLLLLAAAPGRALAEQRSAPYDFARGPADARTGTILALAGGPVALEPGVVGINIGGPGDVAVSVSTTGPLLSAGVASVALCVQAGGTQQCQTENRDVGVTAQVNPFSFDVHLPAGVHPIEVYTVATATAGAGFAVVRVDEIRYTVS